MIPGWFLWFQLILVIPAWFWWFQEDSLIPVWFYRDFRRTYLFDSMIPIWFWYDSSDSSLILVWFQWFQHDFVWFRWFHSDSSDFDLILGEVYEIPEVIYPSGYFPPSIDCLRHNYALFTHVNYLIVTTDESQLRKNAKNKPQKNNHFDMK